MKTMGFGHCKISKETGNLNRQKGTCMKCYNMEVQYIKTDVSYFFFWSRDDLGHM